MQTRDTIELAVLVKSLFNNRRRAIRTATVAAGLTVLGFISMTPEYESTVSFQPTGSTSLAGRFGGLAAQFGLDVGAAAGDGPTPDFYSTLLSARPLLVAVGKHEVQYQRRWSILLPSHTVTETVGAAIGSERDTPEESEEELVRRLHKRISVTVIRESGVVSFTVRMPGPDLAQQVAGLLIAGVQDFNTGTRQSQARAERAFVEQRLAVALDSLGNNENRLKNFLQANRADFRSSPGLMLEYERLQRRVTAAEEVYNSLSQSLEKARIDEVRDTPVISIIEPPYLPHDPQGLGLAAIIVVSMLVGTIAAIANEALRLLVAWIRSRGVFNG